MSLPTSKGPTSTWLCPEPGDRERLLDLDGRMRRSRATAMVVLSIALLACGPWVGWWPISLPFVLAAGWWLLDKQVPRVERPEWLIAGGWLLSALGIFAGTMLTGGMDSPAKSWILIPALSLPGRFPKRGVYAGVAFCLALLGVEAATDLSHVAAAPQEIIFPVALLIAALAMSMALRSAEIQHRSEAVIDQLTGMLNRKALQARTVELELQSRVTGQPVGLIVCDIDNFKAVNDDHGHATGDAVLSGFAYRIRKELRAYDLAYRLGGEEFVVLLPGAALDATEDLAERLRAATEATPIESVPVTSSFGVAVSGADGLEFDSLFAQADEALYRAKEGGRNRVVCAAEAAAHGLVRA